ncbi:MAG: hypothetical protein J5821_04665 [Alphaproteobacteria bacterium]|nr:hypothetical protein [Alphaproteobacteria bacterium]
MTQRVRRRVEIASKVANILSCTDTEGASPRRDPSYVGCRNFLPAVGFAEQRIAASDIKTFLFGSRSNFGKVSFQTRIPVFAKSSGQSVENSAFSPQNIQKTSELKAASQKSA